MNLITLFLFILLPGGTYQAGSMDFPTKAVCEPARQALIAKAARQPNPWLISQCGERDEPVDFRMFMNESAVQPSTKGTEKQFVKPDA